jgi:Kef-type K+ transport system membrane component KefB
MAVAGVLADAINLPGIVGAFLAGLAVNRAAQNEPAKEKLEFFAKGYGAKPGDIDLLSLLHRRE